MGKPKLFFTSILLICFSLIGICFYFLANNLIEENEYNLTRDTYNGTVLTTRDEIIFIKLENSTVLKLTYTGDQLENGDFVTFKISFYEYKGYNYITLIDFIPKELLELDKQEGTS